mgnify:CR=1 FL=1
MNFKGFTQSDFDVFQIEGLEGRMNAIKQHVRPKLEQLGEIFAERLTERTNEDIFFHVAKHARRKVNPPNDTWVAFSTNKRGYKALPHFQIGLFETHVFVWFAIIYEAPIKVQYAQMIKNNLDDILNHIPKEYVWSIDHMKPEGIQHSTLTKEQLEKMALRLENIKKAELLCGIHLLRNDPILKDADAFIQKVDETFTTLMPLYRLTKQI